MSVLRTQTAFGVSTLGLLAALSLLPIPALKSAEAGALITYDEDGNERWRAKWNLQQISLSGQPMVSFTETGEGRYSPFKHPVRWKLESLWRYENRFCPQSYEKKFTDLEGNLLVTERFSLDWDKNIAQFERIDHVGNHRTEEVLKVPLDTLTTDGIATALRALPYDSPRPLTVHLLTNAPELYKVTFKIEGREKVKTPAGDFDCYKVKMDIDLGFLDLFKVLVPDTYFWFTVAPPHFWVRYEGLESGPGSPKVVRVLTDRRDRS
ncbi:MAG: DUF3108 domain-containing protein [Acidobacteriota bacterium]